MSKLVSFFLLLFLPAHSFAQDAVFVENKGQVSDTEGMQRSDVLFTTEVNGAKLFFFRDRIAYVLKKENAGTDAPADGIPAERALETYRFDLVFENTASPEVIFSDELPGISNYYLPHCGGITDVRSFRSVVFRSIYAHTDLHLGCDEKGLVMNFVMKPGADINAVNLRWDGGATVSDGETFRTYTPFGAYEQSIPFIQIGSEQLRVAAGDPSAQSLPTSNTWATYIGGSNPDYAWGIDIDDLSRPHVTGYTQSTNLPVGTGTIQSSNAGDYDAYIFKLDNTGSRVWATYYGGTGYDYAYKIKVHDNAAVVCGYGSSTDLLITPNAWQQSAAGSYDAFLLKLNADGTLSRSTYFGGSGGELALALDIDDAGNVFFGGSTSSPNLPVTANAFQGTQGGALDAFCAKLDSTLSRVWCTYYGGTMTEDLHGITLDKNANVIFTGGTYSTTSFPVSPGAYQPVGISAPDGYVVKLDSSGTRQWATYLGGSAAEDGTTVTADKNDNIYIGGYTQSMDFPTTPGAYEENYLGGVSDAYITKFRPGGTLAWSTFYGGTADDYITGLDADSTMYVFAAGYTSSTDLPVSAAAYQLANAGMNDGYFVRVDTAGAPEWSTYFGGSQSDNFNEIATVFSSLFTVEAMMPLLRRWMALTV
jgi:hypothetical protein